MRARDRAQRTVEMIGMRLEEIVAIMAASALLDERKPSGPRLRTEWRVLNSVLFDADKPIVVLKTEVLARQIVYSEEA